MFQRFRDRLNDLIDGVVIVTVFTLLWLLDHIPPPIGDGRDWDLDQKQRNEDR